MNENQKNAPAPVGTEQARTFKTKDISPRTERFFKSLKKFRNEKLVKLFEDVEVYISSTTKAQLEQINKEDLAKYIAAHNLAFLCSIIKMPLMDQARLKITIVNAMNGDIELSEFAKDFIEGSCANIEKQIDKLFKEMKELEQE